MPDYFTRHRPAPHATAYLYRMRLALSFLCVLCFACERVVDAPAFDVAPRIELVAVSAETVSAFTEPLLITLAYEDGDGDLGTSDPDVNLITVRDSRLPAADTYYLPPLAPEGETLSIQGELLLELPAFFLLGNGSREEIDLTITLTDRAGNTSNAVGVAVSVVR